MSSLRAQQGSWFVLFLWIHVPTSTMADAGYDPRRTIDVMEILDRASGGGRQSELFSTHPNPENRIEQIQRAIDEELPDSVLAGLEG